MLKNNKLLLILKCAWPQATFYICDLQPATYKIALPADALLGMDILGKSKRYVVTRSKSKQNEGIVNVAKNEMVECDVHS